MQPEVKQNPQVSATISTDLFEKIKTYAAGKSLSKSVAELLDYAIRQKESKKRYVDKKTAHQEDHS
jgi:hypothetical protein